MDQLKSRLCLVVLLAGLSACAADKSQKVHDKKDGNTVEKYYKQLSAMQQEQERKNYESYIADCKFGLTELSWQTKRSELLEDAYQVCMREFRAEMDEEGFHKAVVLELKASALWLDSALWLHKKGLYVPLALDLCQQLAIAPEKFLYLPRMSRYPVQAARDGIEGKVVVTQVFDGAGFHKEFVEIVSTPERVFSRNAERLFSRAAICPTGSDAMSTVTLDFTLKNNKTGHELSEGS
ncbi:hypothetical protein SAMN05660691_03360 [Rheinheimera pacifica]|uniref:TonB C-terminal domain-containing protein n=1 Tax=Rheinheimera pacifica TaxID=173990 RepID=A0A1H6N519_9GAMM|nr:hypothetical protein [Rheinheimera pacifica]SEI07495.1 hypothetical protein SAMN05660691_03360 [Rheinheimera pacifica]